MGEYILGIYCTGNTPEGILRGKNIMSAKIIEENYENVYRV